jgi:hypothetical protein
VSNLKYGLAGFFGYGLVAFPFVAFPALIVTLLIVGAVKLRAHLKAKEQESYTMRLAREKAAQDLNFPNSTNVLGTAKPDDWEVVTAVIGKHLGVRWYKDNVMDEEIWDVTTGRNATDRILIDVVLYGEDAEDVKACAEELRQFFAARSDEFQELHDAKQEQLLAKYEETINR